VTFSPYASSPFRNSTTQGTASIPVNGSLTLPPPSSPDIKETIVNFPENGALQMNAEGSITYTPNANFVGVDTFEIKQCVDTNGSDTEQRCETITVAVEVTTSSNNNATPPPTEPSSSSSSSKGIYGLAALAVVPLALLFYIYQKKHARKEEGFSSEAQTKAVADGESLGSRNPPHPPPVTNVAWSVTVPPSAFGSNRSNHYLPSNKDQVRDVIPLSASDQRVDDISVITQSTTHHDNESFVPQPLLPEDSIDSNMMSKNYQRGSGRLHPLAAHLIEVRSNSAGASQHDTVVTPSSVVAEPLAPPSAVAEPQARAINSAYGSTKRILQESDAASSSEPVLVNAILISDDDDIADLHDAKLPANRLDI
jgi:Bacterial Ig domain